MEEPVALGSHGDHRDSRACGAVPAVLVPLEPAGSALIMSDFIQRSRGAIKAFAQAWRGQAPAVPPGQPSGADAAGPRAGEGLSFADTGGSASDPRTWLALFEVAATQNVPVSAEAIAAIKQAAPTVSP